MEDRVVEVALVRKRDQGRSRFRRKLLIERDGERAATRVEDERVRRRRVEWRRRSLAGFGVAGFGSLDARTLVGARRDGLGRVAVAIAASAAGEEHEQDDYCEHGAHGLRSYPPMPNVTRCDWAAGEDELMRAYHDEEWGVPSHDDRHLYELLTLEGAQAGLSWSTILRKREGYRRVFAGFDPEIVAQYTREDVERLLDDPGIVRNRLKVESTVSNAARVLEVQKELGSFDAYLWAFVDGEPIVNRRRSLAELPTETELSKAISKDLKKRGFRFVGPTVIHAFMQAVGMVDDHMLHCFRRA